MTLVASDAQSALVCMYVCMVVTYTKSMDQPGEVANPARGQLNRENVEDERADAGRDGPICLARPNSQARTGTGEKNIFPCFSRPRAGLATLPG